MLGATATRVVKDKVAYNQKKNIVTMLVRHLNCCQSKKNCPSTYFHTRPCTHIPQSANHVAFWGDYAAKCEYDINLKKTASRTFVQHLFSLTCAPVWQRSDTQAAAMTLPFSSGQRVLIRTTLIIQGDCTSIQHWLSVRECVSVGFPHAVDFLLVNNKY